MNGFVYCVVQSVECDYEGFPSVVAIYTTAAAAEERAVKLMRERTLPQREEGISYGVIGYHLLVG